MKNNAFTLIELMVVILIIGILLSVSTVSIVKSQKRGRDVRRKSDIAVIQSALENYFSQNKTYPGDGSYFETSDSWIPNFSNYLARIPRDPLDKYPNVGSIPRDVGGANNYIYWYWHSPVTSSSKPLSGVQANCPFPGPDSNGYYYFTASNYELAANLENGNDPARLGNYHPFYDWDCTDRNNASSNPNAYFIIKKS